MASPRKIKVGGEEFSWPDKKEVAGMARFLSRKKAVSQALPAGATAMDRGKWDLCAEFIKYLQSEKITQRELAKRLKIGEARVSEIVRYKIDKLTFDQLLKYLERIRPDFRIKVA